MYNRHFSEQAKKLAEVTKNMSLIMEEWRDLWTFKIDFILASVSYALAYSNFFSFATDIADFGARKSKFPKHCIWSPN